MDERMIVEGVVSEGRRLGRRLGFPTANIEVDDSLEIPDGVYASRARVDGRSYPAMSNLGRNPSVGGCRRRLETHIFGYEGKLYGRTLCVELLQKIRDEQKFATVEELRGQLIRDGEEALRLLSPDN